jgi:hypothetical protein
LFFQKSTSFFHQQVNFISMFKLLQLGSFLLLSQSILAQNTFTPKQERPKTTANSISKSLKVDGKLDELEWKNAPTVQLEFEVEPHQGEKAKQITSVKLLYNKDFLYIAGICHDSLGKKFLRAPDFRRDFELRNHDSFGVTIDGFNDKRNAMTLVTNPYGTQRDLLAFDDRLYDVDWDGLWRVRTSRSDSGWVAEMAIPWQTLRYPKNQQTHSWGINFSEIVVRVTPRILGRHILAPLRSIEWNMQAFWIVLWRLHPLSRIFVLSRICCMRMIITKEQTTKNKVAMALSNPGAKSNGRLIPIPF